MKRNPAIFNTDQVNLGGMMCPASELMLAEQRHYQECLSRGLGLGMPAHVQHDMHRLFGWTRPLGLYVDGAMVRVLGLFEEPETDQEKKDLEARASSYWEHHHRGGAECFRDELIGRASPANVDDAYFLLMEAAVVVRPGIAAELYPDLFKPGEGLVDKDGLADYRDLLRRMKQVQSGVFHDPVRDVILFAHRFFRRSLSHRNKLNEYFLQSFAATAEENGSLRVRLRLDPDLLGHPSSARAMVELEHWRGPPYSDDIASIPSGVTEHKADERSRFFEGVDRTQVWWKAPEQRLVDCQPIGYRTLEMEELIENPSGGLGGDQFGCRYVHAEFSADQAAITHFDGAIRAYAGDSYLERIETSIDRAGKHADYTKLFRFDGVLAIPHWKRLLSDFFRGNKLIPEYLGALPEVGESVGATQEGTPSGLAEPTVAALINLHAGSSDGPMRLYAELCQECSGQLIPYVEIGVGAVATYLRSRIDLSNITTVGITDDVLNMSRLRFGAWNDPKATFAAEVAGLALALQQDVDAGLISRAAIPFTWAIKGLLVTLTIAGDAGKVSSVLQKLPTIVDPTQEASEWIEALSDFIKGIAPLERAPVMWGGVRRGVLEIGRSGVVEQQMRLPDALLQELLASGKLKLTTVPEPEAS